MTTPPHHPCQKPIQNTRCLQIRNMRSQPDAPRPPPSLSKNNTKCMLGGPARDSDALGFLPNRLLVLPQAASSSTSSPQLLRHPHRPTTEVEAWRGEQSEAKDHDENALCDDKDRRTCRGGQKLTQPISRVRPRWQPSVHQLRRPFWNFSQSSTFGQVRCRNTDRNTWYRSTCRCDCSRA